MTNLRKILALWLLLAADAASAQTNVLYGNVGDYSANIQPGVQVTLTLLSPNPRTSGNFLIQQDPVSTQTDTNGYFAFTNILFGWYSLAVAGQVGTYFQFPVGTNTTGPWPIAALSTNTAAVPPNPATNYVTLAQAQALVAGGPATTGAITNLTSANTSTATVSVNNNVAVINVTGGGGGSSLWSFVVNSLFPTGQTGTNVGNWTFDGSNLYP